MTDIRRPALAQSPRSDEHDGVDRALVAALREDPLASYRALGDRIGVNPRTAQRRYEAMRASGALRVVARPGVGLDGRVSWMVRIPVTAGALDDLVAHLARVQRARWVRLSRDRRALFVAFVAAAEELESILASLPADAAQAEVVELLTVWNRSGAEAAGAARRPVDDLDRRIIGLLEHDGRAEAQGLGRLLRVDATTISRRRRRLLDDGLLSFHVDADLDAFADHVGVAFWLDVRPGAIARLGERFSAVDAVDFVAATAGTHAMLVTAELPSLADVVPFVDERLADQAVSAVRVQPLGHTYKRLA